MLLFLLGWRWPFASSIPSGPAGVTVPLPLRLQLLQTHVAALICFINVMSFKSTNFSGFTFTSITSPGCDLSDFMPTAQRIAVGAMTPPAPVPDGPFVGFRPARVVPYSGPSPARAAPTRQASPIAIPRSLRSSG